MTGDPHPPAATRALRLWVTLLGCWLSFAGAPAAIAQRPTEAASPLDAFEPLEIEIAVPAADVVEARRGRLTTADARRAGRVLDRMQPTRLAMLPLAPRANQFWSIVPVTSGVLRIQTVRNGRLHSLTATGPAGAVAISPTTADPRQLWRSRKTAAGVQLESLAYPGRALAGGADGVVQLERSSGAPAQQWLGRFGPLPPAIELPPVQLAERIWEADPERPPVTVRFANPTRRSLRFQLIDRSGRQQWPVIELLPGRTQELRVPRRSGGRLIERYRVETPFGVVEQGQTVTNIPPPVDFIVRVTEKTIQSIAIDRTGKSPQVIEDIQYRPREIGSFALPAGDRLREGTTIDLLRNARPPVPAR